MHRYSLVFGRFHKMHLPAFALLLLVAAAAAAPQKVPDKYTNKFDTVDIDQILASERLVGNYFNCLMERGPCTAEGTELRSVLPDALETGCSKCNEKQKNATEKVLRHLSKNKPNLWTELTAKYDPEGKYRSKYESEASSHGVKV
ncbi:ejaculatory bulb-specific protein 3-like [Neocloeon triangulifer]|uniref:ejaculatory bulb-specific protein 3-like n=1 Tax=Neocloeon triangulifer TaxID=2078957 RepID=UPI00286F2B58|nr:ejaculatory bulb-specific protein 3-like [Neocloeon triangulifer]